MIKQGAKLVDDAQDIISELGLPAGMPPQAAPAGAPGRAAAMAPPVPAAGGPTALLDHLGYDPVSIDHLAQRAGLTIGELSAMLLELELAGVVAQLAGGKVQRIGGA